MSNYDSPRRIYVVCLASYNSGRHHGGWIDCTGKSADDLRDEVSAMLRESPCPNAEEFAIHDHEGFGYLIGEYTPLETVALHCEMLDEYGELWAAYAGHAGEQYATREGFEESYVGTYSSLEDWAEEWLDDSGTFEGASDVLRTYFDFSAYAHDAELNGDIYSVELGYNRVAVFWNH